MMLRDEGAKEREAAGTRPGTVGRAEGGISESRQAPPRAQNAIGAQDAVEEALGNFRLSVQAWSEAAMRPFAPAMAATPHSIAWRRTLAWAMGILVAVGAASGGVYEHHRQEILGRQAQQRQTELQQRAQAAQRAAEMDQLLANVDQDVSQEVPDALEPLAQMMTDGGGSK